MNEDLSFYSRVSSLISPKGSLDDPKGKEGLAEITAKLFRYGTKNYPQPDKLFTELENYGAIFDSSCGLEVTSLGLSVPKDNLQNAEAILEEIINNTLVSEESLEKAKKAQIMEIDELESDDHSFAVETLMSKVLRTHISLGNKESIQNIEVKDVVEQMDIIRGNRFKLSIAGADEWRKDSDIKLVNRSVSLGEEPAKRMTFIDRELEQKVLCYGFNTKGVGEYEYGVRLVSNAILYSDMVGLVPEKIREENSAAYYAYGSSVFLNHTGMLFMCAGVSEENLEKALGLMMKLYSDVSNGDFESDRVEMAKNYMKGSLDRTFDSLFGISSLYAAWICRGKEVPKYDDLVESIFKVKKEDIMGFFNGVTTESKPNLVINGNLSDKTKNSCEKLMNHD